VRERQFKEKENKRRKSRDKAFGSAGLHHLEEMKLKSEAQ
jgi:hypothetical protein